MLLVGTGGLWVEESLQDTTRAAVVNKVVVSNATVVFIVCSPSYGVCSLGAFCCQTIHIARYICQGSCKKRSIVSRGIDAIILACYMAGGGAWMANCFTAGSCHDLHLSIFIVLFRIVTHSFACQRFTRGG